MWIRLATIVLIGLCPTLQGCGGDNGPARLRVFGMVEHQSGSPVNGSISFLPAATHSGPAANGTITNGKFDIPQSEGPTAGPHQVIVSLVPGKTSSDFAKVASGGGQGSSRTRWEFKADVSKQHTDFDFVLDKD